MRKILVILIAAVIVIGAGIFFVLSGGEAKLPQTAAVGSSPTIPAPEKRLVPTIKVAKATGWPSGMQPTPGAGLSVHALATGLQHPRWLYVLPNGDVLVAETNAP